MAEIDITPPFPMFMGGYVARSGKSFEGINDRLSAGVISLKKGNGGILIIRADINAFTRSLADTISSELTRKFKIPPGAILFNGSHTHSGPAVRCIDYIIRNKKLVRLYEKYIKFLIERLIQAVTLAIESEEPASLSLTKTTSNLAMNRRANFDGTIKNAPNPDGYYDPDVPVIVIKDQRDSIKGVLFSYACHPVTLGSWNYNLSADYPGYVVKNLKKRYHANAKYFFLQGCAGNTRPRILADGNAWRKGRLEDLETQGKELAGIIIDALNGKLRKIEFKPAWDKLDVQLKLLPEDHQKIAVDSTINKPKRIWAEKMLKARNIKDEIPFAIQRIALSEDFAIIAMSGEVVAEIGRRIKNIRPGCEVITLGYSNGSECYVPSEKMFTEGGYEVESYYHFGLPGKLDKKAEDVLVTACNKLLKMA